MAHGRFDFLTNEATAGEILAGRLSRGKLSVREGLQYALQIGEILSSAHSRNLFHGDLSPACIVLTDSGARVLWPTFPLVHRAGYGPADELDGREPDALTDIFAFGALLYEMMTGQPPPDSEQETEAAMEAALWSGPGGAVPLYLRQTITSLMDRDRAHRRQRIQTVVIDLKLASTVLARLGPLRRQLGSAKTSRLSSLQRRFKRHRFAAGAAMLFVLAGCTVASVVRRQSQSGWSAYKFTVGASDQSAYIGSPAMSPDGSRVAFSAIGARGERMVWVRSLDTLHAVPLSGTEGGSEPFWSPDSQSIGFFASGSLKRVSAGGGSSSTICSVEQQAGGGAWDSDGSVVYAPSLGGGLYRVSAVGGSSKLLFAPDSSKGEQAFLWPALFRDGQHVLFFDLTRTADTTGVYIAGMDGTGRTMLLRSTTNAVLADMESSHSGEYLLFLNGGNLVAQSLDPSRLILSGEPWIVANDVGSYKSISLIPVSASNNGVLAYQSTGAQARQLVWTDRNGASLGTAAEPGDYGAPRISSDGAKVAVSRIENGERREILIVSESRVDRLGDMPQANRGGPIWSWNGSELLFSGDRAGNSNLYSIEPEAKAAAAALIFADNDVKEPTDWSPGGKYVLFDSFDQGDRPHVWALSVAAGKARHVVSNSAAEKGATFSPDGKWIAYQSEELDTPEIYVQPFVGLWGDGQGRKRLSAVDGGVPRWSRDGTQLCYLTSDGDLMAVDVRATAPDLQFGVPRKLFHTRHAANTWNDFDVSPDGQRFIVNLPLEDATQSPITVLTTWPYTSRISEDERKGKTPGVFNRLSDIFDLARF